MKKILLLWDRKTGEYYGAVCEPNPQPYSPALLWESPVVKEELPGTRSNAGLIARNRTARVAKARGIEFLD